MQIIEYRITLPLTVEEYQIAQLYTIAETIQEETDKGKADVLKNEAFTDYPLLNGNKFSSGQYTAKIYQCSSKIPSFMKLLSPNGAIDVHEEAWDAYPYCRTIVTNPKYRTENFYIKIESLHLPDSGEQENVHELPQELLNKRIVVYIDIANDKVCERDYKASDDPKKFQSLQTGRGPLIGPHWRQTCNPVMTCYKLVTCKLKLFGLQNSLETFVQQFERRLLTNFHRLLFCSMDRWYGLTLKDFQVKDKRNTDEELSQKSRKVQIFTDAVQESFN